MRRQDVLGLVAQVDLLRAKKGQHVDVRSFRQSLSEIVELGYSPTPPNMACTEKQAHAAFLFKTKSLKYPAHLFLLKGRWLESKFVIRPFNAKRLEDLKISIGMVQRFVFARGLTGKAR